jgi:hypothetical protein
VLRMIDQCQAEKIVNALSDLWINELKKGYYRELLDDPFSSEILRIPISAPVEEPPPKMV